MNTVTLIIHICGYLFVIFSLVKLLKVDHWSVRFFDYPQAQFLVFGILILIASLVWVDIFIWWNATLLIIIIAVLIYQIKIIVPYTFLYFKEIKSATKEELPNLKVLVSNVYQPNKTPEKLLNHVNALEPDIIFLVETNERWGQDLKELEKKYPYRLQEPLENMYGLLFYSKIEIKEAQVRHIIKDDIPSVKAKLVLDSGKEVWFYGLHPEPPSPTENYRSTERDAELYKLALEINDKKDDLPVVVAGDLNDVAWSKSTRIFQKSSGLLDPRKGRGFFNTFHAKLPIRWPLDHIFVSKEFKLNDMQVLDSIDSDHFPIYISLTYAPLNTNGKVEQPDQDETEEVERQIEKAE